MCIGLVSHVPDQLVNRHIENFMYSEGEFDYTQIGSQMTAVFRNGFYNNRSDFISEFIQFIL